MGSLVNSTKYIKREITPIIHNLFQRTETEEILSNSFCDSSIMWIPKADKDYKKRKL